MSYNDLLHELRARGHRLTTQRRLILEVLQKNEQHMSAEEIGEQIKNRHAGIQVDMATIYRNLRWLSEHSLVTETSLGQGHMVYVLSSNHNHHHHLVCNSCQRVTEVRVDLLDELRSRIEAEYGFTARLDHIAFFGLCRTCRGNGA
ncbi:transcriptional repressor [Candidatus Gracilibacteria bacterium]|nr:transcriptional repressor [Candidatus Gracilibacteria bacterium]